MKRVFSWGCQLPGVFAFECLVAAPAFLHSGAAPASAAKLRRSLGWLAWAALALALISGAAWLVAVAAGMSGKPLGAALSQGAMSVVLTRTRFGEDWLLRFALAVLLGSCLLGRRRRDGGTLGWTALTLAALMLASLAWAGQYFQIGAEAILPVNRLTGHGYGGVVQLHFYLDDLFPRGIGRPISEW